MPLNLGHQQKPMRAIGPIERWIITSIFGVFRVKRSGNKNWILNCINYDLENI
jgi:hypothetical protein